MMVRDIAAISMKPFMGKISGLAICDKCDFFHANTPTE